MEGKIKKINSFTLHSSTNYSIKTAKIQKKTVTAASKLERKLTQVKEFNQTGSVQIHGD